MSIVLLDTNVVSYIFKGDTRAAAYGELLQGQRPAISFMTVAELYEWAHTNKWGQLRTTRLEQTLSTYIIISADRALCKLWGSVRSWSRATGRKIASQDAWIAATALRHDLPLVTHDPGDFLHIPGRALRTAQ